MVVNQFGGFYVNEESMRLALVANLLHTLRLSVEKLPRGQRNLLFDRPGPFLLVHRHELLIEFVIFDHLRPPILQQSIIVSSLFSSIHRGAAKVDINRILAISCN